MPTILDLSRDEWQPYIEAVRQQAEPRELTPAEREEREHVLARVREAGAVLKQRFRAAGVPLRLTRPRRVVYAGLGCRFSRRRPERR